MQIFSTAAQFSNYSCTLLYSSTVCNICEDFFSVKVHHHRLFCEFVLSLREVTERIDLLNKMVKNVAVNPERVQELVEKRGLTEEKSQGP